jgi:hypothetical protein
MEVNSTIRNRFAITFDIEWAPDEILLDLLNLLSRYSISVTSFATHQTPVLKEIKKVHEVGLHPNFNPLFDHNDRLTSYQILEEIKTWYPDAVGVRSHSRTVSATLVSQFISMGLQYDANQICPYQKGLLPYTYRNFCRFTDFWQDDVHAIYRRPFALDNIPIDSEGVKIFNFHPIHIYLNTDTIERYQAARPHYQDSRKLLEFRNTKAKGVRDLLIELLNYLKDHRIQTYTLKEIAFDFLSEKEGENQSHD